jgi:hypothetical protein
LGLYLEFIPWDNTLGLYLGFIPWVYTLGLYLGFIPWVYTLGLYLGFIPWDIPWVIPWVYTLGYTLVLYLGLYLGFIPCRHLKKTHLISYLIFIQKGQNMPRGSTKVLQLERKKNKKISAILFLHLVRKLKKC